MKIYISGKITGSSDYMERFQEAETMLKEIGHEVINPAKVMDSLPSSTTHIQYMILSFDLLDMCDGIYMLSGRMESAGANQEYGYAIAKDKVIMKESSV